MKTASIRIADLLHPSVAALISVIVNYGGTFILVFQGAKAAGLSPEQTASWIWSISIGVGLTGAWLSYRYREPIITAWSTPGAAFLIAVLPSTSYPEMIGAFMLSAVGFVVLGMSGYFERVVKLLGFVRCAPEFTGQPAVIDGCSTVLVEALGEAGRGARSAVGVVALPFGIPVEVEAVVQVRP